MANNTKNTDLGRNDGNTMLAKALNKQLDKWIDDCNLQSEHFLEKGMIASEISADAMRIAYMNVKSLIKDFS